MGLERADRSNGYESIAQRYLNHQGLIVGLSIMQGWIATLETGAAVLDLGCGSGMRVSQLLLNRGFEIYGVDASISMVEAYRVRCPGATAEHADVLESTFFDRAFGAAAAWGLLFLLTESEQRQLIAKVGRALQPGGHFLFTAPWQKARWPDAMTARPSLSLGREAYLQVLKESGFRLESEAEDEGGNHYYFATREENDHGTQTK